MKKIMAAALGSFALLATVGEKALAVWPSSISFMEEGHMDAAYIVLSIGLVTFSIGLILLCEKL